MHGIRNIEFSLSQYMAIPTCLMVIQNRDMFVVSNEESFYSKKFSK